MQTMEENELTRIPRTHAKLSVCVHMCVSNSISVTNRINSNNEHMCLKYCQLWFAYYFLTENTYKESYTSCFNCKCYFLMIFDV
jgi:hypothetical protein